MKKRIIHLSKSTVSVILTLCMLVSCVTVGLIATDAAQLTGENRVGAAASEDSNVGASSGDKVGASVDKDESVGVTDLTVYYSQDLLSGQSLKLNVKYSSKKWIQEDMVDTNHTIDGKEVYAGTVSLDYDGFRVLQFQVYSGSDWVSQVVPVDVGDDNWISDLSPYQGKYYDGANWVDPVWDTGNHAITIDTVSNGTITANKASAAEGATVTVTPTGDPGYKYDWGSLTVTKEGGGTVDVNADSNNNLSFVMPDGNVTVSADFVKISDDGVTTIYVANHANVQKIYVWNTDSSETTISAVWPGDHYDYAEGTYVPEVFNRGGIAYYKYEIPNTRIINDQLKIIVNGTYVSGGETKTAQTNDILINKGYTYYVGWSGKSGEDPIYKTINRYPTYTMKYKVSDADDSTLKTVPFEYSKIDHVFLAGNYQFFISKSWDGIEEKQFNNHIFVRSESGTGKEITAGGTYCSLPADVNGSYRFYLDSININNVTATITYPAIQSYNVIGEFENGQAFFDGVAAWTVNPAKNSLGANGAAPLVISRPAAGTYRYKAVVTATSLDGNTYYTYFPSPLDSPTTGCKEIEIAADCTSLTFTFNSSTGAITAKAKYPTDWPPSDIETTYTDDVSGKYLVYSNNDDYTDDGSGSGNISSYSSALKQNSDGTAYWFDLTDLVLSDYSTWSNFYFCLSSQKTTSGILGTGMNSVTDSNDPSNTKNNGGTIRLPGDETKTLLLNVQNQQKGTTTRFPSLHSINRDKLVHLGVEITNSSGTTLDYKFYYQEDAKVSTGPKLVKIYAKNGELRDSTYNRFTLLADTQLPNAENIDLPSGYTPASGKEVSVVHNKAYGNSNYDYAENVPVGSTITISTQLKIETDENDYGNTFANTHYLKAYSMNGKTYEIFTPNNTGRYTQTWTIPEDWADDYIEITPIYYLKDSSLTKTFYIEKYAGSVQDKWGNLLSVYPYYEGKDNKANAFGGYPGQPMLYWGGKYQMEIPLTVDGTSGGAPVKGLTIHNSYWDLLHRSLDAKCKDHCQTYDYDDFYVLCKEKNPDTIYFTFEYHGDQNDNYSDGYEYTTYDFVTSKNDTGIQLDAEHKDQTTIAKIEGANGAEIVTDYYGRQVDIFGNLLNTNARSTYSSSAESLKGDELLIVSDGYKDTYVGEYATIWAVYKQDGTKGNFTFLGYISSSMLYLNSLDNVKNYANGTSESAGRMSDPNFTATYNALQAYKGKPVLISYEEEIWNNTKDKANRSDGKWYYSAGSDKIRANIKIQYANSTAIPAIDDVSWKDESNYVAGYLGENNTGAYTGCSAYFTNTVPNIIGKQSSDYVLVDNSKFFTFKANAAGKWVFAGWVRQNSDGKYDEIESTEGLGKSNISANDTYIARFVKATAGTLLASHTIEQTATYTGTGTPSITATLVASDGTAVSGSSEITVTNGSDINLSSWMTTANATRGYKIKFDLGTNPATDCAWVETLSKTNGYAVTSSATTSATYAISDIADMGTTAIRFVSHLSKTQITYAYEITYYYESRFWGEQFYKVTGTVPELLEDTYFTGNKTTATLNTDFIKSQTPFEKNFRQDINWNYSAEEKTIGGTTVRGMTNNPAGEPDNGVYTMIAEVWSGNIVDDKAYAEFKLPYAFDRSGDMTATKSTTFASREATESNGTEIVFDEGDFASKTVESQFYKLFAYDKSNPAGGENVSMTSAHLVQAAPYVWKGATKHYTREYGTRTMSGTWTVGELTEARYVQAGTSPVPAEEGTTYTYYDADGTSHTDTSVIYYKGYQSENDDYESKINYFEHLASYDLTTPYQKQDGYELENATKYYFSGWKVYTTDMEYVATSYQPYFNLSAYDNYIVIPQYESDHQVISFDSTDTSATITYLGDSRNQWTEGGQGNYQAVTNYTDGVKGADKLIADFGISYEYNGQKLYTMPNRTTDSTNGHNVKIGMVIERMTALDEVAGVKQTSGTYYSEKFSASYRDDKTNLENYIKWKMGSGGSNTKADGRVLGRTYYAIGSNVDGYGVKFNTDQGGSTATGMMGFTQIIDNFNRLQYFHTITKAGTYSNTYTEVNQQDYAFRAVAFIEVDGALTLSDPVYFTVYETANRTSY